MGMGLSSWLRHNAEHYLLEAAQTKMARHYLGREGPVPDPQEDPQQARWWRELFVPTYQRLPWTLRSLAMRAMPGSHRRRWDRRPRT